MDLFKSIMTAAHESDSISALNIVAASIGVEIPDDAVAKAEAESDDNNWANASYEDRVATMMRSAGLIVTTILPVTYLMQKMQAAADDDAPDGDTPSSEVGVS